MTSTRLSPCGLLSFSLGATLWLLSTSASAVVNGEENAECVFPTAVYIGGCTATLVHPRAITTAQHCSPGAGTVVTLGEEAAPSRGATRVTRCITGTSLDGAICELETPILDVPLTPVLLGCEVDKYLTQDEPVWFSGYGNVADMIGTTEKRWAESFIREVHPGHTVIGDVRGDSTSIPSPCRGDSGGPVFLRVADGSYRVFGTVYQGTTGIPCNGAANFQRVDTLVATFESETGIDISPCFDADTGEWNPDEDCGGFYAGEPDSGVGSWQALCADAEVSGESAECGEPFSGPPTPGTGGQNGGDIEEPAPRGTGGQDGGFSAAAGGPGTSNADGPTGNGKEPSAGGYGDSNDGGGCSCRNTGGPRAGKPLSLFLAVLLGLLALMRKRTRLGQ